MHKTFRKFNSKTYLLDEFSYSNISKPEAEKREAMWKKSVLGARLIKKANGKYVVYREYPGDKNAEDGSSLFHVAEIQSYVEKSLTSYSLTSYSQGTN